MDIDGEKEVDFFFLFFAGICHKLFNRKPSDVELGVAFISLEFSTCTTKKKINLSRFKSYCIPEILCWFLVNKRPSSSQIYNRLYIYYILFHNYDPLRLGCLILAPNNMFFSFLPDGCLPTKLPPWLPFPLEYLTSSYFHSSHCPPVPSRTYSNMCSWFTMHTRPHGTPLYPQILGTPVHRARLRPPSLALTANMSHEIDLGDTSVSVRPRVARLAGRRSSNEEGVRDKDLERKMKTRVQPGKQIWRCLTGFHTSVAYCRHYYNVAFSHFYRW